LHNLWTDSLTNANLDGALGRVYGYDALSRLAHATNADGTYPTGRDFYYDGLGRLTGVDYGTYGPASACSGNGVNDGWICSISNPSLGQYPDSSKTYAYDQVGNRTDQGGSYGTGNRIQSLAGLTFAQDLDGNDTLKTGGGQTYRYEWSTEGRLQSVVANGTTVTYRYDALGRLVRRVRASDSTTFLWEGNQVLAEINGTATARVGEGQVPSSV
jgi:YD repeat-containing protein